MAHTVMFYDMSEPHAPVYENENQQHMYRFLLAEHQKRETWYYPESAYWITFDVSVPMLLLPYLKARLTDIDSCAAHHIPGHLTFSSGWEWGYWLVDWSIARWSWQHTFNGAISFSGDVCTRTVADKGTQVILEHIESATRILERQFAHAMDDGHDHHR